MVLCGQCGAWAAPQRKHLLNLNYKKNNTTLFGSYAYTNNTEIRS